MTESGTRQRREDAFRQRIRQGFWRRHRLAFEMLRLTARLKAQQFCSGERLEGSRLQNLTDSGLSPVFIWTRCVTPDTLLIVSKPSLCQCVRPHRFVKLKKAWNSSSPISNSTRSITQSCLTLCSPVDCSPPGSSVHGIFQARILKWVAISFSRGSYPLRNQTCISCIAWQILYH